MNDDNALLKLCRGSKLKSQAAFLISFRRLGMVLQGKIAGWCYTVSAAYLECKDGECLYCTYQTTGFELRLGNMVVVAISLA